MFVVLTTLNTVITLLIGTNNLAQQSLREYVSYSLLPNFFLGAGLYTLMAKRQACKAWLYSIFVFVVSFLLGSLVLYILVQQLYLPTIYIELPLSILSAIIGTAIGIKWHQKGAIAT